jgi:hypothetical protein
MADPEAVPAVCPVEESNQEIAGDGFEEFKI